MGNSFTKNISWPWNNAEKILVFLFFATFPFNLRKVFLTPYSFPKGEFNEYMTLSLNWSDILILSLIIIYIIKRLISQLYKPNRESFYGNNNNTILSSITHRNTFLLHCITRLFKVTIFSARSETFLLFLFFLWLVISIIWAPFRLIAIYRLFIIFFIFTFAVIIRNLAKKGDIKAEFIYLGLFTSGIFQSLIGISQFILNRSLGLKILGESILGPGLPGVAKIIVSGVKHIRAYGTFPHPNILAGFLVIPIVLLVSLLAKRFTQKDPAGEKVSHETILAKIPAWFLFCALFINMSCFILTFTRSAFLSLFLAGIALLLINLAYAGKKTWLILAILFFTFLIFGFINISRHSKNFLFSSQSLEERNQYLNVSREIIIQHPLSGVGLGQFVFQEIVSNSDWPGWQYQPTHNIYFLIASELGIVGLALFLLLLLTILIKYCIVNDLFVLLTKKPFCFIILSFLFISFFDHYFWDVKLGIITFILPFLLMNISVESSD